MTHNVDASAASLACGGAPATVKPGIPPTAALGGTAITAALTALGAEQAALIFDVVLAGVNWDITNICTSGDPGDVTLTLQDYADVLNVQDLATSVPALAKFHQWIAHAMFPQWCNCADGSGPPPATPSIPPAYQPNPGAPTGVLTPPCWNTSQTFTVQHASSDLDVTKSLVPYQSLTPIAPGQGPAGGQAALIPTGVTQFSTAATLSERSSTVSFAVLCVVYDVNGNQAQDLVIFEDNPVNPFPTQTKTYPIPSNGVSWAWYVGRGDSIAHTCQVNVQWQCGNTGNTVSTPCCPPDPSVDIRLRSIQDMLGYVMDHLGVSASGFVDGTRHAGLSNSGSVTLVASCAAIRVEVKSSLVGWPNNPGTPNYYFSLGFITSIAIGSPLKGWRLVYGAQTFPIEPYADQVGYTLPPGVQVDVVELLPK